MGKFSSATICSASASIWLGVGWMYPDFKRFGTKSLGNARMRIEAMRVSSAVLSRSLSQWHNFLLLLVIGERNDSLQAGPFPEWFHFEKETLVKRFEVLLRGTTELDEIDGPGFIFIRKKPEHLFDVATFLKPRRGRIGKSV